MIKSLRDLTMNECLLVKVNSPYAILPSRATPMSVGYDLSASEDRIVAKHGWLLIPTDIIVCIPYGHYGRIAPRSGLTLKFGIDVGAGVIDPDYRGSVGVILFNHSDKDFVIQRGDKIAQLILEKVSMPDVIEIKKVEETVRNDKGFGSTGK